MSHAPVSIPSRSIIEAERSRLAGEMKKHCITPSECMAVVQRLRDQEGICLHLNYPDFASLKNETLGLFTIGDARMVVEQIVAGRLAAASADGGQGADGAGESGAGEAQDEGNGGGNSSFGASS